MPAAGNHPEAHVKTVLFATDFSFGSRAAGHYARRLAESLEAALVVAHAYVPSNDASEREQSSNEADPQHRDEASPQRIALEAALAEQVRVLSTARCPATAALVEGAVHDALARLAETLSPALLVLGTRGGSRQEGPRVGSVAEQLLRSTRWPCVTVGPQVHEPAAAAAPRRILFVTDFTPAATRAVPITLAFSHAEAASLAVLNVIPDGARQKPAEWADMEDRFTRSLAQVIPEQAGDFLAPSNFIESEHAHTRILELVQSRSIELLVLGMRKASHLGFEARSSDAFEFIADAPCPVLTMTS